MTTPERLRRRQLIEGGLLIVIGIVMVIQSLYNASVDRRQDAEDRTQRECLANNFAELSQTLSIRGDLSARDSNATQTLIVAVFEAKTPADAQRAFLAYSQAQAQIQKVRDQNPIPPYPAGECS